MKRFICSVIFVCIIALSVISFPAFGESNIENITNQESVNVQPTDVPNQTSTAKRIFIDAETEEIYESMDEFLTTHEIEDYFCIGGPDGRKVYFVPLYGENALEIRNKVFEELGTPQLIQNN